MSSDVSSVLYRALFDLMDEAVCFIRRLSSRADGRRDYQYLDINPAARKTFGVGDLRGQSVRDHFPDESESWYDDYDHVLATGETIRLTRRSDPQEMMIEMTISRIELGHENVLMILMRDVTSAHEANAALKQSQIEAKLLNDTLEERVIERTAAIDRMWNTSPDLMVEASLEGIYQRANPAWLTILGHEPPTVVGSTAADFTHPEDVNKMQEALATVQKDTLPSVDLRFRHKDGSYRWIQWVAAPSSGLIFAIGRDMTAAMEAKANLARTEEQLRQSQKMEAIGRLTGGIAHDFNNLLTVMSGAAEMLKKPDLSEEKRTRYVESIAEAAERAATLTSHLLAFSRRRAIHPEVLDLNIQMDAIGEMLARSLGGSVEVIVRPATENMRVEVDATELETAVLNAAVNARYAMPNGGDLTIAIREGWLGDTRAAAIEISDTGVGMTRDVIERVFEPYFTTKPVGEGTGLGLSQIQGFAAQAGGTVEISSTPGEGTTVRILLPRVEKALKLARERKPLAQVPKGLRVLLVEDNLPVRQFAEQLLSDLGTEVAAAQNGAHALQLLQEQDFDLVFTDVVMPGLSGIDLARQLRIRAPELPVLLATGYSEQMLGEGPSQFPVLAKPYGAETLSEAIRDTLERSLRKLSATA